MLDDLDQTVKALLARELPPTLAPVTISFVMPDSQFPPSSVTLPAINCFLYDVRENRELRSNEWLVERQSDASVVRRRPPVRVACAYLITAWPGTANSNPSQDEHYILGQVMRALLRYPTLPAGLLQGSLASQQPPLPTTALLPAHMRGYGEIWQAMGGKPKAMLYYSVTISVDPFDEGVEVPPVVEKVLRMQLGVEQEGV
jgi:uncharacterized protein DUF4255